jgi:hypothetical protein
VLDSSKYPANRVEGNVPGTVYLAYIIETMRFAWRGVAANKDVLP